MSLSLLDLQGKVKNKGVTIRILEGSEIDPYLDQIAAARIKFFKEFPYLYEGVTEYEKAYLQMYRDVKDARIIIGEKDGKIVGFTTGVPLNGDNKFLKELSVFFDRPEDYYYLGEVIINPEYRDLTIPLTGMRVFEEMARSLGYPKICFIGVEREKDHPLRPHNHRDIAPLMMRLGYTKTNHIFETSYSTIQPDGTVKDTPNKMVVWVG